MFPSGKNFQFCNLKNGIPSRPLSVAVLPAPTRSLRIRVRHEDSTTEGGWAWEGKALPWVGLDMSVRTLANDFLTHYAVKNCKLCGSLRLCPPRGRGWSISPVSVLGEAS